MSFNSSAAEIVFADADSEPPDIDMRPAAVILRGGQSVSSDAVARWCQWRNGHTPIFVRLSITSVEETALAACITAGAAGILLDDGRNRADIQALDVALGVAEALTGTASGTTEILAEFATTAQSLLSPHSLAGASPRLKALLFDADRLAQALGLGTDADPVTLDAIRHARVHVVLKAREAGLPVYEVPGVSIDRTVLHAFAARSFADGFAGLVMRSMDDLRWLREAGG